MVFQLNNIQYHNDKQIYNNLIIIKINRLHKKTYIE